MYQDYFSDLSLALFESVIDEVTHLKIPDFAQLEINNDNNIDSFVNSLAFTKNLLNVGHLNGDKESTYVYGISTQCTSAGVLASRLDGYNCNGGHFFVDNMNVYVDLASCDGMVEMIWRSTIDVHCTTKSQITHGFDKVGTAIQINEKVAAVMTWLKTGHITTARIKGIAEILTNIKKNKR
jgi:hypothetical protein